MQTPHEGLMAGRLARPDIIKPIGDLATAVQNWFRNHATRPVCGCRLCWRKGCEVHVRWLPGSQRTEHPFSFSVVEQTTDISVEIHHRSQGRFAHILLVSMDARLSWCCTKITKPLSLLPRKVAPQKCGTYSAFTK